MKLKDFIVEIPEYEFIGGIFPKNKLSILHGDAGSGKSYSVMKFLNEHDYEPVYVNLDYTPGLEEFKKVNVDSNFLNYCIEDIDDDLIKEIKKHEVIVIDTYTVFSDWIIPILENKKEDNYKLKEVDIQKQAYKFLDNLTKLFDMTVIVIGHTADFVGKANIFRDNPFLIRNSAEALWLEKAEYKATKTREAYIEYNLHIMKGRGSGGAKIINDWMRDSDIKIICNKINKNQKNK